MRSSCVSFTAMLILWSIPVLLTGTHLMREDIDSRERSLTCICTTSQCRPNRICVTQYKCYFEYHFTKEGKNEMKWGCISSANSLLCEDRIFPIKSTVHCCDDKDFCNLQNGTAELPMRLLFSPRGTNIRLDTSVPIRGHAPDAKLDSDTSIQTTSSSVVNLDNTTTITNVSLHRECSSCSILEMKLTQATLMLSLLIMMGFICLGFYVIRKQSLLHIRYVTRSEYIKAQRRFIRYETKNVGVPTPANISVIPPESKTVQISIPVTTSAPISEESSVDKALPEDISAKLSSFTSVISPVSALITTPIPSLAIPATTAIPLKDMDGHINVPTSVAAEMLETSKVL